MTTDAPTKQAMPMKDLLATNDELFAKPGHLFGLKELKRKQEDPGGYEAVQLRVAEDYIARFGELAKQSNTMILPANAADVGSMIALAMTVLEKSRPGPA